MIPECVSLTKAIAHDIRDYSRITAKTLQNLTAESRWCLTGTPIQNSIDDIAGLYHFLKVEPYTNPRIFKEHIRLLCNGESAEAIRSIQKLIGCIMLRRSIETVSLPAREDLVCRLDFNPEEAEVYKKAKTSTLHLLNEAIDGDQGKVAHLNVLPWINSLRTICNLGVRAKSPQSKPQKYGWNLRAAQKMFNSLGIAGTAMCRLCSLDLSSAASEAADQVSGTASQPRLSSCSHLVCVSCLEKFGEDSCCCSHVPSHPMLPVSTFSSELSMADDLVSNSCAIPTKISALLQDLKHHIDDEKWYVTSRTAR